MIKPLRDRVVVRVEEPDVKSKGGLIIPDVAKEKPSTGVILAVGPGKYCDNGQLIAVQLTVGDKVLFGKFGGTEVTTEAGDKVLILKEEEIIATVKQEESNG